MSSGRAAILLVAVVMTKSLAALANSPGAVNGGYAMNDEDLLRQRADWHGRWRLLAANDDDRHTKPPAVVHRVEQTKQCNCSAVSMDVEPVCGFDGQVYMNHCVPDCQQVDFDFTDTTCLTDSGMAHIRSLLTGALHGSPGRHTMSISDLTRRFGHPRFRFVGFVGPSNMRSAVRAPRNKSADIPSSPLWPEDCTHNCEAGPDKKPSGNAPMKAMQLIRVTAEGYLFTREVDPRPWVAGHSKPSADDKPTILNPTHPATESSSEATAGRRLLQLQEALSPAYPWSAVGFVSPQCTGALIAPNKVLTAGHCVWNAEDNMFVEGGDFYPNQHAQFPERPDHFLRRVRYSYKETLFTSARVYMCEDGELNCFSWDDYLLDFAVITLSERIPEYGSFKLFTACGNVPVPSSMAGYPADRPGFPYRMFYDTAVLDSFDYCTPNEHESLIGSDMETHPGQSGSAIWTVLEGERYIRALHIAAGPVHRGVTAWMAAQVEQWMGD